MYDINAKHGLISIK